MHHLLTIFAALAAAPLAFAQPCPGEWQPGEGTAGINGTVWASTAWDPDGDGPLPTLLVVGGTFTIAGKTAVNNIAAWNGSDWLALGSINGQVRALTVFNGELVASGGPTPASSTVLRWTGSQWIAIGDARGMISALTVFDGELVALGISTLARTSPGVARWDGAQWHFLGADTIGSLGTALAVYQGSLYAVGVRIAGAPPLLSCLQKWTGTSWIDVSAPIAGAGATLCVFQDALYVGGMLNTNAAPFLQGFIARFDGANWTIVPSSNAAKGAYAMAVSNGRLFVGGQYSTSDTNLRNVAAWDGSAWDNLDGGLGDSTTFVRTLTAINGVVFAGGELGFSDIRRVRNIAQWNGSEWKSVGPGLNGSGPVLVQNQTLYRAAEWLSTGNNTEGLFLQRWTPHGWQTLGQPLNLFVSDLESFGDSIIAAGSFTAVGGLPSLRIAQFINGWWQPMSIGMNSQVRAVSVVGSTLYAGGQFTLADNLPAKYVARWTGSAWEAFGDALSSNVAALCEFNGDLIAGGEFTTAGSLTVNRIARWDGQAWNALGSGFNGPVYALRVFEGALVAGGTFTKSGTQDLYHIARWDGSDWQAFDAGVGLDVAALHVHQGKLIAAGVASSPSTDVRRWTGSTWESLNASTDGTISSMASHLNDLVLSGSFINLNGAVSARVARWRSCESCPSDFNADWIVNDDDFASFVASYSILDCADESMVPGCPADLNLDGFVDDADFVAFVGGYNELLCP